MQNIALSVVYSAFLCYICIKSATYYTMKLYEHIKKRRLLLGLTQQDLADISGVSLRTIKLAESAGGNPSANTLIQLGDALGLELVFQIKQTGKL